jgi:hypothetical protein
MPLLETRFLGVHISSSSVAALSIAILSNGAFERLKSVVQSIRGQELFSLFFGLKITFELRTTFCHSNPFLPL